MSAALQSTNTIRDWRSQSVLSPDFVRISGERALSTGAFPPASTLAGGSEKLRWSASAQSKSREASIKSFSRGSGTLFKPASLESDHSVSSSQPDAGMHSHRAPTDRIIFALETTEKNWAGPGSMPPLQSAIDDFISIAYLLQSNYRMPEVEVDQEDGSVHLIWSSKDKRRSFLLAFNGNGRVIGALSCLDGLKYTPWAFSVSAETAIASRLSNDAVEGLLSIT
jgi:hypothetical protein